jgi:hypothetical protein
MCIYMVELFLPPITILGSDSKSTKYLSQSIEALIEPDHIKNISLERN